MSPVRHRAAVLGSPIAHSLSPALHRAAYAGLGLGDWSYDRFEVGEHDLAAFLDGLDATWAGLSLTMPLKRVVFDLVDEVGPTAAATGAANTLLFDPARRGAGGRVHRRLDNTDVSGIVAALTRGGLTAAGPGAGDRAVVLGGGATAASAVAALHRLGWDQVVLCVRSVQRAGDVLTAAAALGVGVSTAPLTDAAAVLRSAAAVVSTVPGDALGAVADGLRAAAAPEGAGVLLDVVYDPWPTRLAAVWQARGGQVVSGLDMLIFQAADQVRLMTGREPDVAAMQAAVRQAPPHPFGVPSRLP